MDYKQQQEEEVQRFHQRRKDFDRRQKKRCEYQEMLWQMIEETRKDDEERKRKNAEDERRFFRFLGKAALVIFLLASLCATIFYDMPPGQAFGVGFMAVFLSFVVLMIVSAGGFAA